MASVSADIAAKDKMISIFDWLLDSSKSYALKLP